MKYTMLKGKIHRAVVKQADLNYVGSITVDTKLLDHRSVYFALKHCIIHCLYLFSIIVSCPSTQ